MTIVRLRGLKQYTHPKTGIQYTYHRASGTCLEPPHKPGTPEFFAAWEAAEAKHKKAQARKGTFGAAVDSYRQSPAFLTLRDRTRSDYERVLGWLAPLRDMSLHQMDTGFVAGLRDKAFRLKKRRFANYMLAVLSVVMGHAAERRLIPTNPVIGLRKIRRPTNAPEANIAWTEEEKRIVLEAASLPLKGPIAMARYLGLRQGDVLALPKTARRDRVLTVRTSKTGTDLILPISDELAGVLDAMPEHEALTFFATSRGKPWTGNGFRASFFKLLLKLAKEGRIRLGLTFHGLRTSFAQEAATLGFDERETADAMGHSDTKTTKGYIRKVVSNRNMARVAEGIGKNRPGT